MKRYYLFIGLVLCALSNVFAQEKISSRSANEINFQAKEIIQKSLPNLLNAITNKDEGESDLAYYISNSYNSASNNRIFRDSAVIIVDDLDPAAKLGDKKDITVQKYLKDMTLKYEKTHDGSITFSNIQLSAIKKREYIYVRVKFDVKFGSKYKINNTTYPVRQREAMVKMENAGGNKWNALITSVDFFDPTIAIDSIENNMTVTKDSTLGSEVLSVEELNRQQQAYDQQKAAEQKLKDQQFDDYVKNGNTYIVQKLYKDGLLMFARAKGIKSLVPSLDKAILDAKRDSAAYTYDSFKNKGDIAQRAHHYDLAIDLYRQAISLKQGDAVLLPQIDDMQRKMHVYSLPKNLLESGNFKEAIAECDKVLDSKEIKGTRNSFPELYYIEALAYQKIAEANISDSHAKEKAIENFNAAISFFPNYIDALIARAHFLVKYDNNLNKAISDYDQLTTITLDTASEKPSYFLQKARWKDLLSNYQGALGDYAQAIKLNPNADSIHYARGEMLYRMQKFDDAKKDFDKAIELNPQNSQAFYIRGLNYFKQNNNDKAGDDFADAQKIGIPSAQLDSIRSISDRFCFMASDSIAKRNFTSADIAYDNALKISRCNSNAFLGKADIRYTMAEELLGQHHSADAKKKYFESIENSDKAIKCNPNFSDAFYRKGMAHQRIGENDLAIRSFSEAVRSNTENTQAYIERGNVELLLQNYKAAEDDYSQALRTLQTSYENAKRDNLKDVIKNITYTQSVVNQLDGEALYYMKDYANALIALGKALDKNEYNTEALYYKGLVHFAQGDLSRSISSLDQALRYMQQYKYSYADGCSNLKNKKYIEAIHHFTDAIRSDSLKTIKNVHYLRGLSYFKNKNVNAALQDYAAYSGSDVSKTDTAFLADYGTAQLFTSTDADAFNNFTQALTLSATNAKALFGVGCYYAKNHNFDKALEYIEKAFSQNALSRDDIEYSEEAFLTELIKNKTYRPKYDQFKKMYSLR